MILWIVPRRKGLLSSAKLLSILDEFSFLRLPAKIYNNPTNFKCLKFI